MVGISPMSQPTEPSDGSPLIAAYAGELTFVVPFLRAGGPVDHSDRNGDTMLHAAASGWQHRMVEFLILNGADINARNSNGETALHILVRSRKVPHFIFGEEPLDQRAATFAALLVRKADRTILDNAGGAPLHVAAWEGDIVAVDQLAIPTTVDQPSTKGATALMLAVLNGHVECARRLLALGASLTIDTGSGRRPIDLIESSKNPEVRSLSVLRPPGGRGLTSLGGTGPQF